MSINRTHRQVWEPRSFSLKDRIHIRNRVVWTRKPKVSLVDLSQLSVQGRPIRLRSQVCIVRLLWLVWSTISEWSPAKVTPLRARRGNRFKKLWNQIKLADSIGHTTIKIGDKLPTALARWHQKIRIRRYEKSHQPDWLAVERPTAVRKTACYPWTETYETSQQLPWRKREDSVSNCRKRPWFKTI